MRRVLISFVIAGLLVLSVGTASAAAVFAHSLEDIQDYFAAPSPPYNVWHNLAYEPVFGEELVRLVQGTGRHWPPNVDIRNVLRGVSPFAVRHHTLRTFYDSLAPGANREIFIGSVLNFMPTLRAQGITGRLHFAFVTVQNDMANEIRISLEEALNLNAGALNAIYSDIVTLLVNQRQRLMMGYELGQNNEVILRTDFGIYGGTARGYIELLGVTQMAYEFNRTHSMFGDVNITGNWHTAFISLRPVGGGSINNNNNDNSDGCNVSTVGAFALLLLPVLAIVRRRK